MKKRYIKPAIKVMVLPEELAQTVSNSPADEKTEVLGKESTFWDEEFDDENEE